MAMPDSDMGGAVPWPLVLDQAAGPVAVLDLQARHVYANPALCRLLGYSREELLAASPSDVTHPGDPVTSPDVIEQMIVERRDSFEVEKRLLRSDGTVVWTLVSSSLIRGPEDRPLFFLSQFHDVSARREAEQLWNRTLSSAPIGMALLDLDGHWTEVNDMLCEMVGYHRDELLTMHFTDLTYSDDADRGKDLLVDLAEGRRDTASLEKRYRHKDGHPCWMLIRTSVVPGADGSPAYLVSQYETVGDGRMRDSHLAHMALHDPLTGLANRALLLDRLGLELDELATHKGVLAVLLADLDELKPTNDDYGHLVGDRLLTAAAGELLEAVRPGDTVARFGGDEFVILARVADFPAAEALRERVSQRLDTGIVAAGHHLSLTASVGLAATSNPGSSADDLLHSADRHMYQHKRNRQ